MTTCERYAEAEAAERYVAGRMTADDAADFEQHFLACDACLETVRGIEDVRDVLDARRAALARGEADPLPAPRPAAARRPSSPKTRAWAGATWLAAAAALIAAIGWMLGANLLSRPGSTSRPGPNPPAVARGAAPVPAPSAQPPAGVPAPSPGTPPPAGASGPVALIARLAIVIPPPYVAVPVRGEAEDAQKAFAAAMTRYRAGDYAAAATGLRALVEKSPDLPAAQFYLGICELMMRRTGRAETALRAAADSEVTPYADEAYFYLAKAALQRGDLAAAERALTEAVAREAGPGNEARRLLEEVRALGQS